MTDPNPTPYPAGHRMAALRAAAEVFAGSEIKPRVLVCYAEHLRAYLDDGTVPPHDWL